MKKHLSLLAFFVSTILLFDSAFAQVSEGCEILDIKEGCDISGWLKLFFGVSIGAFLAILLHTLAHRVNLRIERNREELKENTEKIRQNSVAIQKILDVQEYTSNRRRDYLLASLKSSFGAILLRLGMMNIIVENKKNIKTDEQYRRLELEENEIQKIIEKVGQTISLAVDILDPMLATQIDNILIYIEPLCPSKNNVKLEFSEYEEAKEKILHLKERLKEFVTSYEVIK